MVSELARDAWTKFDAGKKLLLVFVSLSQTYTYLGRENLNEENASIRLAHRQVRRVYSWLMTDVEGPRHLRVVPTTGGWE